MEKRLRNVVGWCAVFLLGFLIAWTTKPIERVTTYSAVPFSMHLDYCVAQGGEYRVYKSLYEGYKEVCNVPEVELFDYKLGTSSDEVAQ